MSSRPETPSKKPSGGRPLPRRLFSFDSLRKERSGSSADQQDTDSVHNPSRTRQTEKTILEHPDDPFTDGTQWTEKELVTSPEMQDGKEPTFVRLEGSRTAPPPLDLSKSTSVPPDAVPTSPSKRRWDTIRHHVLPVPGSSTPPPPSIPPSDTASLNERERPSTPKLYRFGQKKAFRQVVETAHHQHQTENRKFADALWRACWALRVGEAAHRARPEREGTLGAVGLGTMGSSLHLPFMASSASLPVPGSAAALPAFQTPFRGGGLRRPPSMQSLMTLGGATPSVSHIARVLHSTSSVNRPTRLPHENLVLSALLMSFVSPSGQPNLEAEQGTAVEIFEVVVRHWKAPSNEVEVERCVWCCKAASVPSILPHTRMRILGTLSSILFSRERTFEADSPLVLQTLFQALLTLKYNLSLSASSTAEVLQSIAGYISAVQGGGCGELNAADVEKEFGVRFSSKDSESVVREAIITEAVINCVELGPLEGRQWALRALGDFWPKPEPNVTFTPLLACIHWRKLRRFIAGALALLSEPLKDADGHTELMIALLRSRILPEINGLREEDSAEIRGKTIRLVLELLSKGDSVGSEYLLMHLCNWYQTEKLWREGIESALSEIIGEADWQTVSRIIPTLVQMLPSELQAPLTSFIMPSINKRLVSDPPEGAIPPLAQFLDTVSRQFPKIFYKPLFVCAAASKDATVVAQLCTLHALAKRVPDLFTRDPEMISVALVSDASASMSMSASTSTSTSGDGGSPAWGMTRIGQAALLVELIERLREAHESRDLAVTSAHVKFATALELRLGVALEAKEKTTNIPLSLRVLFCALFREIRLLIRSLKSATWLVSAINWTLYLEELPNNEARMHEVLATMRRLETIYSQAEDGSQRSHKRRPTAFSPLSAEVAAPGRPDAKDGKEDPFKSRRKFILSMSKAIKLTALDLLVTISGMLEADHYARLGPVLWRECLLNTHGTTSAAACFLYMQYAEKVPEECTRLIEDDLASPDATQRRLALERMSVLSTWRFQILSQEVILDRTHRRPFKLQRPPILFVATDIGSSLFVYEDDSEEYKDINGHVIPLELRRRLAEIGWAEEDRAVDPRIQRIKTPMSLLPSQQLDRLDDGSLESSVIMDTQVRTPDPSPANSAPSPTGSPLGRRDSHPSSRHGSKRRPVFVPTLASMFPRIAALVADEDFSVASLASDLLMDFMRDDPALISRAVFQIISGDDSDVSTAVSSLRAFLHIRDVLPPAMSHHILNHLAGFLKSSGKLNTTGDPLRAFAYSLPIIAKVVTQVSKLSIREIRRAKVDPFMLPSGSLWFPSNAPTGPLFPRYLEAADVYPFSEVPPNLIWITMIRASQNMLFLSMLKRNAQDIKVIRKNMSRLELPSLQSDGVSPPLTMNDMFPRQSTAQAQPRSMTRTTLTSLSLTLSRSYLLLIEQMFQCMPRHLSDREELALLIDGLIRILLAHGDDIGIVAHVMLALMTAGTRFKRLFISGGAYTLFMPALIKTYVEAEYHPNIRRAIAYATNRFYALHQESFVFQSFDVMGPILASPEVDGRWVASGIFALFATLKSGIAPGTPDAAGIHELNKAQEQEAMMITMAEEVPQTFLATLKRSAGKEDKTPFALAVPDEYEGKRLKLDDLVRLFLTVIAHNPASQRAEHFLRFLRLLTPHLHATSRSVQNVLRGGIYALGGILTNKVLSKPKESSIPKPADEAKYEALADSAPPRPGEAQGTTSSDFTAMRLEYLSLVTAFTGAGGHIGNPTTMTTRVMDIIRIVLRDSKTSGAKVSVFLADFVRTLLIRHTNQPSVKEATTVVEAFLPLASSSMESIDFSHLFNVLAQLLNNPMLACDPTFSKLIVTRYCRFGLDACEAAASEDFLFTFPLREALVKLLTSAITTAGADVMAELEKQPLSHNFLAGIILPMTLMLKTSADIIEQGQWGDKWRKDSYSKVWLRLLALILGVLKGDQMVADPPAANADRRKSTDGTSTTVSFAPAKAFSIALQILKIIVVRAQEDISEAFPGVWIHIAGVLKAVLEDGDALFALSFRDVSEPPSPAFSPRVSSSFEQQQQMLPAFPSSISMHSRKPLTPPRIIDYLTWSFIQWLWLRRSPLMLQMRIFVQERVANLASELRQQGTQSLSAASGGSRRSQRLSTVFSKPRRSMLGPSPASSAPSTPRTSAFGMPSSLSLPVLSDFASPSLTPSPSLGARQAGYARQPSPVAPGDGPRIVHLGPVNASALAAMGAPRASLDVRPTRRGSVRALAKDMTVHSPGLVRMTYRRIRLVQQLMGYTELLPMGGSEYYASDDLDAEIRVWSQRDAIEAVVDETRELLDEFRESFGDVGDESMVVVDSQLTLLPDQSSL